MGIANTVYKISSLCHRKLKHQANGSLREPALYLPALKDGASRALGENPSMLFWAKSKIGRLVEGAAWALDAGISFGFISGAVVAAATGRFLLGGILAAVAVGVFLRFKRRRAKRSEGTGRSEV